MTTVGGMRRSHAQCGRSTLKFAPCLDSVQVASLVESHFLMGVECMISMVQHQVPQGLSLQTSKYISENASEWLKAHLPMHALAMVVHRKSITADDSG